MISVYQIFGWINVGVLIIIIAPFLAKTLSKKNAKSVCFRVYKSLRPLHRVLGIILAITSFLHGTLALGTLSLHTGTVLGILVLLASLFGGSFVLFKKKPLLRLHIIIGYTTLIILLVHIIVPSLLYF